MSQLAQHFLQNQFCLIVEYLSPDPANPVLETHLAGFPLLMSLADRVHSDDDALPLELINHMWRNLWQIDADMALSPTVEANIPVINFQQKIKYQFLKQLHETIFCAEMAQHIGCFVYQSEYWGKPWVTKTLLHSEMFLKHQTVGCEHCGQCRLHETLYVCPETCPKGLANGPCGGTHLDQCEFGNQECIHSFKARIAIHFKKEDFLKQTMIPTIPKHIRGSSSWQNWFQNRKE